MAPYASETRPRVPIAAAMKGPGPAKYKLPSCVGQEQHDASRRKSPAYSFGQRLGKSSNEASPGPAYLIPARMTHRGMDGTPAYSLHGRTRLNRSASTPGPGAYAPEKKKHPAYKNPAEYSFGLRTKDSNKEKTPAPNAYTLPSCVGGKANFTIKSSAPSYSMTSRSTMGSFHEDLRKTPGPGSYKITEPGIYKNKHPSYSMNGRNYMPSDATKIPGPGTYKPENVYMHKKNYPKFSFGIRHSQYISIIPTADD